MIEQVHIKKFRVLEDFNFNFDNKNYLICGCNGLGKSSLMKFIQIALGDQNVPPGAEGEGEVWVNKQGVEYKLAVKIKDGKSKVTITGPDGLSDSRKGMLANIMGAMSFDITQFIEMSRTEKGRKQQVEIFKGMLPEDARKEIERYEANVDAAFEERTQLNKDIKLKEAEIKSNPLNHLIDKELNKFQPVDVSAVMAELKAAQEHNATCTKVMERADARSGEIKEIAAQIEALTMKMKDLQDKQDQAIAWLEVKENGIKNTKQLEEAINNATKSNKDYENAKKLKADKAILEKMVDESQTATVNIESQRQVIQDTIKDLSGSLVPGLTFDRDGLIYNGIQVHPDTHSTSEQIELGIKMKIAENPEIGVLFIEHSESIDEDRWKTILDICNKNEFQVLAEEVRRGSKEMVLELVPE